MSGAGGGKRPSGGDSPPGPPEKKSKKEEKTTTTLIEPIRIAGVSSTVSHLVLDSSRSCCDYSKCPPFLIVYLCFFAGGNGHEGHSV